jgi:hypothetical protein
MQLRSDGKTASEPCHKCEDGGVSPPWPLFELANAQANVDDPRRHILLCAAIMARSGWR